MEETNSVLQSATPHSLAIMDELGRGTSTFDGYSIAHAVMNHLVKRVNCRTLFSTHYHMLIDEFKNVPRVRNFHMAFKASEEADTVVFLYKFIAGDCPQSFGLNVARLAGLPAKVIAAARMKSKEFAERLEMLT